MRQVFSVLLSLRGHQFLITGEAYLYEGVAATSITELSVFD